MNIVLDTNVLLVSIGRKSRFNPIFEALLQNKFNLFVSNEILLEYTEILEKRANSIIARDVLDALIIRPNVHFVNYIYYHWQLVPKDPDDDKFIDCAVTAGADYLVTNDKHYEEARKSPFPLVSIISAEEFLEIVTPMFS